MRKLFFLVLVIAAALVGTQPSEARADGPDATEIVKQAHLNFYYARDDGRAQVSMNITDRRGKVRNREFILIRKDLEEGGEQKYFIYFDKPRSVRRTTFMVWKDPAADDARWIYVPALDLIKPISASDKRSSFVGSDFSYEDVSGRHWSEDTHRYVEASEINGRKVHVIESIPTGDEGYARLIRYIDMETALPLREEWQDKDGELTKLFEAVKTEDVDGVMTITERRMSTPGSSRSTTIIFNEIAYDVGVEDDLFQERYMKSPPRSLVSGN